MCRETVLRLAVCAMLLTGKALAQPAPDIEDMRARVALLAPLGWHIHTYKEIASLRNADPVSPELRLRFQSNVVSRERLFFGTGEFLGPAQVVVATTEQGLPVLLHGTAVLSYKNGAWTGEIEIETNLDVYGRPIGSFDSLVVEEGTPIFQRLKATLDVEISSALERLSVYRAELDRLQTSEDWGREHGFPVELRRKVAEAEVCASGHTDDIHRHEERLVAALAAQLLAEAEVEDVRDRLASTLERATLAELRVEALNQNVAILRKQLRELQALVDVAKE